MADADADVVVVVADGGRRGVGRAVLPGRVAAARERGQQGEDTATAPVTRSPGMPRRYKGRSTGNPR